MEKLLLGIVIGSFSLDGTLKILSKTNLGNIRYKIGNKVFLCKNEDTVEKELTVSAYRHAGETDFVKFEEIQAKEEADSLKGYLILVDKDRSILDEGYFFFDDLEACTIISNGENLGVVIKVEEFPAQLTLRVKHTSGKEFFVPFIKEFIKNVDIEKKEIEIKYLEGML